MNELTTLKRPKPDDGEEELFRMQEEFLRTREEPSAKVINLRTQTKQQNTQLGAAEIPESGKQSSKFRSKFAERKALKQQEKVSTSQSTGQMINPEITQVLKTDNTLETTSDLVQNVPLNPSSIILGNIIEKKYSQQGHQAQVTKIPALDTRGTGFPEAFVVHPKSSSGDTSLFWQKISGETKPLDYQIISEEACQLSTSVSTNSNDANASLKQEIHESNIKKLKGMSKDEILEAKAHLESILSSDVIRFLKAKKNSAPRFESSNHDSEGVVNKMETEVFGSTNCGVASHTVKDDYNEKDKSEPASQENIAQMEVNSEPVENETPADVLVEEATTKGWVHMDTIEHEKLEWMKDVVPTNSDESLPEEPYNARFDFTGLLLPFKDDKLSVDKGLHHHGEEPDRPGYSLQELLQLCRSSTQQQRCTSLTTLANIIENSRKGWYDKALHPAPLVALNEKNILLLLRFSLDDTSVAVVTATLQALRSFLYSKSDEICLDRLVGWHYIDGKYVKPDLPPPKTDVKDTSNLKDHELAQLDTVAAALRSDVVLRIRYILSEMHPPPVGVTAALEILTRLARHSRITALNVACVPHLLDTIVQNFIPLSTDRSVAADLTRNSYGVPNVAALRLCRVLVTYGGKPVADKLNNLKIVHSILSYTTSESIETGIRLSIESLRLWKLLLEHKIAMDSIGGARLALLSQLQLLLSNHDLANSSELTCEHAGALVNVAAHDESLRSRISTLLSKWSTQLSTISAPTWGQTKLVAQALAIVDDVSSFNSAWTLNSKILSNLCFTSNLLSGCTPASERDPTSLPSLGVLTEKGQLQPATSMNSCIPFLATWFKVFCDSSSTTELRTVLRNPDLMKYVRRLSSSDWALESSWYTRAELFLATGIVRAAIRLKSDINDFMKKSILKIAIKLISTLPEDASNAVREMLNVVLTDESLTIDKLSNELNRLKLGNDQEIHVLDLPNNLSSIYVDYVSSNGNWYQAAMPKDWLYLPIVAAYTKYKDKLEWDDRDTTKIVALLSLEMNMPELVQDLSPSLRFSRFVLIYLCDTVYLNDNVSILLREALTLFLRKYYKMLDFTADLPGLSSFTDLFTSLCECFCANSYGNDGFAMTLMIPLAQRHDVHYRKLLWSEHAGALRYIRLTPNKLLIPLNEYLYPVEKDSSLIECYLTALVRGTIKSSWCPLMYTIAMHHSAMFLKESNKLAVRMRSKVGELRDGNLSSELLNYVPSGTR